MATFKECIAIIRSAAGDTITEEQAIDLLSDISDFVAKKKSEGLDESALDASMSSFLSKTHGELLLQAKIEHRNRLKNAIVQSKVEAYIAGFGDRPDIGLKALMGGTNKVFKGGRLSIDAQGRALQQKYLGRLIHDLEKDGLFEVFNSGQIDREIAQELWELKPDGNPGISGDKNARRIAEVIHAQQEAARLRQNRAGSYIKNLPGWIVRQSHDMTKIRRAGLDHWKSKITPTLDHEATFGIHDPNKFLSGAWEGLQSGLHLRAKGADESNWIYGFKGPANVAKKASAERLLHFKSADDWFNYNAEFGTNNLREAVVFGLEHSARNIALMEGLGTNPLAMFDNILRKLQVANRHDAKMTDRLKSENFKALFKEIEGTSRIPVNLRGAHLSAGVRVVQNVSKLGFTVFSSLPDLAYQASELRFQGFDLFTGYSQAFSNILRGRGDAEQKQIAKLIGVGFDGVTGDIMARFSAQDSVPGRMAKLQQQFFKLNLMSWWNDSHRTGVGLIMSSHLASQSRKSFDNLDDDTKRIFPLYSIGEEEWQVIRKAKNRSGGNDYITPDAVDSLSNADIDAYLVSKGKANAGSEIPNIVRQRARDEIGTKLQSYFTDRADFAVPITGAFERAFMNRGTSPGTVLGEALRFFFQFKAFPITAVTKPLSRELYGHGAMSLKEAIVKGKADLWGIAHLIVATTLFGYLGDVAIDFVKGRTPKELSTETLTRAMARGGGLGIYGDFLFGDYSFSQSFIRNLSGPTIGQLDNVAEIWTRFKNGDATLAQFTRLVVNNLPFINLFYTRMALDYMILYQLQESVNPGFLRRQEQRIKKDSNQRFMFPPSEAIPHGGGDKLLEGIR